MKIIKARSVIDGTGTDPRRDQAILVEDGLVLAVLPWQENAWEGNLLDLGEATLLPGLIDAHLHLVLDPSDPTGPYHPGQPSSEVLLRAAGNAQAVLRAGVTTVRDCGAPNEIIFPLRAAIDQGRLVGPRILASGTPILPAGGHGSELVGRAVSTIEEIREAVREQAAAGADFIKVMATAGGGEKPGESHYGLKELTALREEAARYDLLVAAHAHGTQGIRDCIAAGIQRIEHCTFFNGETGFEFDLEAARSIAAQEIIVSPTNVIDYRRIEQGGVGAPRDQLNLIWRKLLESGVSFAASSDAGVTDILHDDYALIPELMVSELGMSPLEALVACTLTAAKALGVQEKTGTIEAGKAADLVAVNGDPIQDITALRQVNLVMRNGNILYRRDRSDN